MTQPTIDEQIECLDGIKKFIGYQKNSVIAAKLDAAIASLRSQWRPIETAPKDGTRIMACVVGFAVSIAHFDKEVNKWLAVDDDEFDDVEQWDSYCRNTFYEPTHWKPLPTPPQGSE